MKWLILFQRAVQQCGYAFGSRDKPSKYVVETEELLAFSHVGRVLKSANGANRFHRYAESARLNYDTQVVDTFLEEEALLQFQLYASSRQ